MVKKKKKNIPQGEVVMVVVAEGGVTAGIWN